MAFTDSDPSISAITSISNHYIYGDDAHKDIILGICCLTRAAESGSKRACFDLAMFSEHNYKFNKCNEKVVSAMTQHYLSKMLLCGDDADKTPVRDTQLLVAEALLNKYEGEHEFLV